MSFAFYLYLLSHVLRSLRFWIIYNDEKLSLKYTFFVFQITAVIGYWSPLLVSEVLRIFLMGRKNTDVRRIILTEVFSRALDLCALGVLLMMVSMRTSVNTAVSEHSLIASASLLSGVLVILYVLFLKKMFAPFKDLLIGRMHSKISLRLLELIDDFSISSEALLKGAAAIICLGSALTVLIWLCDVSAIYNLLKPNYAFVESLSAWVCQSLGAVIPKIQNLELSTDTMKDALSTLIHGQTVFGAAMLASVLIYVIVKKSLRTNISEKEKLS